MRLDKFFFALIFMLIVLFKPITSNALHASDPTVSLLQNRITNNFSKKYCKAIQNGYSKDEAMTFAIIKTENIVSFSYNPQKKWISTEDLANQIALKVVNDCGRSFGLIGKEGVNYFKNYFLEIYEKTTPEKTLSS